MSLRIQVLQTGFMSLDTMCLTITQTALIFFSQQGLLYTLMRSLLNLVFQRINIPPHYNQIL